MNENQNNNGLNSNIGNQNNLNQVPNTDTSNQNVSILNQNVSIQNSTPEVPTQDVGLSNQNISILNQNVSVENPDSNVQNINNNFQNPNVVPNQGVNVQPQNPMNSQPQNVAVQPQGFQTPNPMNNQLQNPGVQPQNMAIPNQGGGMPNMYSAPVGNSKNSSKSALMAIVMVVLVLVVIGLLAFSFGAEKTLTCTKTEEEYGMSMKQTVEAKYKMNKVDSISMVSEMDLGDYYEQQKDIIIESFEMGADELKKMGLSYDIKTKGTSVILTVDGNAKDIEEYMEDKRLKNYNQMKETYEDDGYVCE